MNGRDVEASDASLRATSIANAGAHTLSFAYDQLSRNTSVTRVANGATQVVGYQYDLAGRRTRMWLPEAQLYHYKARAYAPSLGRFLQSDPILYNAGMNVYAYVGNDPVNWIDPGGLVEAEQDTIVVTGARYPRPSFEDYVKAHDAAFAMRMAERMAQLWSMVDNIQAIMAAHPEWFVAPTDCPECDEIVVTAPRCDAACQRARDFRAGGLLVLIQDRDAQCTEAAYICLSNVPLTGPFASSGDIVRQAQGREACMTAQRACDMASAANRVNPRQPFIVVYPDGTMLVIERGGSRITRIGNPGGFSRPWPPGSGN